jgi:hypothetical protein
MTSPIRYAGLMLAAAVLLTAACGGPPTASPAAQSTAAAAPSPPPSAGDTTSLAVLAPLDSVCVTSPMPLGGSDSLDPWLYTVKAVRRSDGQTVAVTLTGRGREVTVTVSALEPHAHRFTAESGCTPAGI